MDNLGPKSSTAPDVLEGARALFDGAYDLVDMAQAHSERCAETADAYGAARAADIAARLRAVLTQEVEPYAAWRRGERLPYVTEWLERHLGDRTLPGT